MRFSHCLEETLTCQFLTCLHIISFKVVCDVEVRYKLARLKIVVLNSQHK